MKSELERYKEANAYLLKEMEKFLNPAYLKIIEDLHNNILNPPPEMEEVEVTKWECNSCGRMYERKEVPARCSSCSGSQRLGFTEFKGKRWVPKKVEEKLEFQIPVAWDKTCTGYIYPINYGVTVAITDRLVGKTGTLHFVED